MLGLDPTLSVWLPQSVRVGDRTLASIIANTGTSQECILSPNLYTPFVHDCAASHTGNIFLKFMDDPTVLGRMTVRVITADTRKTPGLVSWCDVNNSHLQH